MTRAAVGASVAGVCIAVGCGSADVGVEESLDFDDLASIELVEL
jgi:hypothetical protein